MLVQCGIPLTRSMELLGPSSPDAILREACARMHEGLISGQPLSATLRPHGQVFSPFHVQMVRVAERSGQLDRILERLADYEEKQRRLVLKVRGALTYPLLVFAICVSLILLSPALVFHHFLPILKSGLALPWYTRALVCYVETLQNPFCLVLLVAGGALALRFGLPWLMRHPAWAVWQARTLEVPGLGPFLRALAVARFSRAMAVQLEAGLDARSALTLAADCSLNPTLQQRIPLAVAGLQNGMTMHQCLQATEFFPRAFLLILQSNEEAGQFADAFRRLADMNDDQIELCAETFASLVEPLMMLVMGLLIGGAIIAFMQPMLQLLQTLS